MGAKPKDIRRRLNRMAELMEKHGWTDHSLGEVVGTAYQLVNRHKLGRSIPNLDLAYKYAKALGTTIEEIWFPKGEAEWHRGNPRPTPKQPHPNDWRRQFARDEHRLLAAITSTTGKYRVSVAIQSLELTNKRALSILGAWCDRGWYDPGDNTSFGGDLTAEGEREAERLLERAA